MLSGNVRFVVDSGQSVFGLETLKADMTVRCLDRPPSKISIYELPFRIVEHQRHRCRMSKRQTERRLPANETRNEQQ